MAKKSNKIELLAPAGSLEKLKYAVEFGADGVYCGVPDVSMRARVNSFTEKDILEASKLVHSLGKKIFVTLNIYAHDYHLSKIEKHLKFLQKADIDAVIVADPGVITLIKKYLPKVAIHLSTQANVTNWQAAKFWFEQGVTRVVLAREVTLEDIKKIKKHVPKLELEYFVHGAMCMSYSGRCILSKWMSGKSANLGDCTQPCRWQYTKKSQISNLKSQSDDNVNEYKTMEVEEVQSGRPVVLEEDSHGTYFFNSKDLNLLAHLGDLKNAGVSSFKIEGRNKSAYYVSNVTRAYRMVLDAIEGGKTVQEIRKIEKWAAKELDKLANRGYTKGFLLGNEPARNASPASALPKNGSRSDAGGPEHNYAGTTYGDFQGFVGEILEVNGNELTAKIHNMVRINDKIEIVSRDGNISVKIKKILNQDREEVESAHGGHGKLYHVIIDKKGVEPLSLMRKTL